MRERSPPRALDQSLDDLVGAGKDRWRDREAESLRGLQIDDQLEIGRLLDRQIGGLGATEDLTGVNADVVICLRKDRPIANQPAIRDVFAPNIDRRNMVVCRQRHNLLA